MSKEKLMKENIGFLKIKLKSAEDSLKFWASINDPKSLQMIANAEDEIRLVEEILREKT